MVLNSLCPSSTSSLMAARQQQKGKRGAKNLKDITLLLNVKYLTHFPKQEMGKSTKDKRDNFKHMKLKRFCMNKINLRRRKVSWGKIFAFNIKIGLH